MTTAKQRRAEYLMQFTKHQLVESVAGLEAERAELERALHRVVAWITDPWGGGWSREHPEIKTLLQEVFHKAKS